MGYKNVNKNFLQNINSSTERCNWSKQFEVVQKCLQWWISFHNEFMMPPRPENGEVEHQMLFLLQIYPWQNEIDNVFYIFEK